MCLAYILFIFLVISVIMVIIAIILYLLNIKYSICRLLKLVELGLRHLTACKQPPNCLLGVSPELLTEHVETLHDAGLAHCRRLASVYGVEKLVRHC